MNSSQQSLLYPDPLKSFQVTNLKHHWSGDTKGKGFRRLIHDENAVLSCLLLSPFLSSSSHHLAPRDHGHSDVGRKQFKSWGPVSVEFLLKEFLLIRNRLLHLKGHSILLSPFPPLQTLSFIPDISIELVNASFIRIQAVNETWIGFNRGKYAFKMGLQNVRPMNAWWPV